MANYFLMLLFLTMHWCDAKPNVLVQDLYQKVNSLENKVQEIRDIGKEIEKTDAALKEDLSQVKRAAQTSFSAYQTGSRDYPSNGDPIVFGGVVANNGNAYNPGTGAFTAPLSAWYVFSASVLRCERGRFSAFYIEVDGVDVAKIISDGGDNTTPSTTVVAYLESGKVARVTSSGDETCVYGSQYSFFTGFLMSLP